MQIGETAALFLFPLCIVQKIDSLLPLSLTSHNTNVENAERGLGGDFIRRPGGGRCAAVSQRFGETHSP